VNSASARLSVGEFNRFGVDIAEARDRFDEALDLILKLWRDDTVTHQGQFYRCEDATLKPKPLQRPGPPPGSPRSVPKPSNAWRNAACRF